MLSRMKWLRMSLVVLVVLALLSGGLAWAKKPVPPPDPDPDPPPISYEITWLGSFGGGSSAWDIDNDGNVVGASWIEDGGLPGDLRAFVYSPGPGMQDLNDLAGPAASGLYLSDAYGTNNNGQVVGMAINIGEWTSLGYRFTPGFANDQGIDVPPVVETMALPGDDNSVACAINDLGEVAGTSFNDTTGKYHVFVYSDEFGTADLGIQAVDPTNCDINDNGQVAGSIEEDGYNVAFRFTPGIGVETTGLFNEPFSPYRSYAFGINNAGEVAGYAVASRYYHAFRFSDQSGMQDLDEGRNVSYGRCINSIGDVAGEINPKKGLQRGFVYFDEFGMLNLDELIEGTAEDLDLWTTNRVCIKAINDGGQICGFVEASPAKAFVLTPVVP